MNAIRKKLNLTKDEELIKTIRGVGYIANDLT
jgi:DNA-binding response OmpR family regulator